MKKTFTLVALVAATLTTANAQVLVAGWDFQTTTTGGTAAASNPGAPLVYTANFGTGTLFLDGSNGSSTWTSLATSPQVTAFSGTAVNAGTGFSVVTTSPASLGIANSSANGFAMVFAFSMAGLSDLSVSYASQRTGTGFTGNQWAHSTDGVTFTNFGSSIVPAGSFAVITLPTVTALNNDSTVFLRYTVEGASSTAGNNRLDNIQFNAIPEPSTWALIGLGLGFALWSIRRRRSING